MGWFSTWAFSILLGSSVGLDHSVQADSAVTELQKIHQEVYRGGAGDGLQQDCSRHSCVHGGQCVFMGETGQVECVCKKCHTSLKPVCGSDGRLYHNHCELHRSGCLQRTHLQPRPNTHCYNRGETCTMLEYDHLKSVLLDSAPRISQQTPESPSGLRRTLVDSLFQQMDADLDGQVSRSELLEISVAEHLERVVLQCTTQDILRYDDYNSDGHLTLQELYTAFQVTQLSLKEEKRISVTEVTVGLSAVLTCAIQGTLRPPIIWRRNGIVLNFLDLEDINDFGEDSLYISKVTTIHIGNYSCHALGHQQLVQTHVLRVKVPPVILVYPESQAQEPGISCSLFCRADGIPLPTLNWLKNGVDLQPLQSKQTSLLMNGSELLISSVRYEDTGAYTCIAKNEVGVDEDISSLFVEDSARKTLANILWREEGLSVGNMFYIFSSDGIKILQPDNCEIRKHFQGSQRILGTSELLCPAHECVWSSAVSVRERLVYAAQPLHHRLLLMDTHTQTVSRVVNTEPVPVRLWYDKSHDQLWILSWGDQQKSKPSLQVITSASAGEQHPVRSLPFQGVEDFYIPPTNLIITHVRFGFIYLKSEPAVHKIDLETLRLVKTISLRNYSCVPASMAYTHLSGFYFIQCRPMNPFAAFRQLLIDGVTDVVIGPNYGVRGRPYVSPDGRFVVSVEERHGRVQVQSISFDGELKRSHRLDVKFRITDLEFQLSLLKPNQYVVAASSTQGSVLFLDLATGGSKSLESIKDPVWDAKWLWDNGSRGLVSGGVFGRYLLSHGTKSLVVLDMKESEPHCAVSAVSRGGTAVWVGEV